MKKRFLTLLVLALWLTGINAGAQSTGLPVISIETKDAATIDSRTDWTDMTSFTLTDPDKPENNISNNQAGTNFHQIRGRGNSTWGAPKKPYRVRFRENVSFFGLPAARNWVLLANYNDRTFLGNTFALELGNRLGVPHTPSYHHVELVLNGKHEGTYLFTEHRQAAPQGVQPGPGRVGIDLTYGWLVEFDHRWHEEEEDPKFRTASYDLPLLIKSPDFGGNANHSGYDIVKSDWNNLCNLMAAASFPENGYRDMIDMESIIDYFFVQIVTNNTDFYHGLDHRREPGSIFMHKDKDGKITAGPLWDFDLSFHHVIGNPPANSRPYPNYPFFYRFFEDPVFRSRWKEKWDDRYSTIASMEDFINEMASKIRTSAAADFAIWHSNQSVTHFDQNVANMKNYLNVRLAYLNSVYDTITVIGVKDDDVIDDDATSVPELFHHQANPLSAWGYNGQLRIANLNVGETLSVHSSMGQLIYRGTATNDVMDIPLHRQGVYVVKAGNRTVKVIFNN